MPRPRAATCRRAQLRRAKYSSFTGELLKRWSGSKGLHLLSRLLHLASVLLPKTARARWLCDVNGHAERLLHPHRPKVNQDSPKSLDDIAR